MTRRGGEDVMSDMRNAEVYRVCAVSGNRWDVYQEPRSIPVASFSDKAAALNYAMCLARGRVAWHLLLRNSADTADLHGPAIAAAAESTPARH
jgi:hypothetical protein